VFIGSGCTRMGFGRKQDDHLEAAASRGFNEFNLLADVKEALKQRIAKIDELGLASVRDQALEQCDLARRGREVGLGGDAWPAGRQRIFTWVEIVSVDVSAILEQVVGHEQCKKGLPA